MDTSAGGATRYYTTLQAWRMSPLQQATAHRHQIYLQRVSHLPLAVTIAFLTTIYRSNSPKSWNSINPLHFIGQDGWAFRIPIQLQIAKGSSPFRGICTRTIRQVLPQRHFPWFEQEGVVFWFSPEIRSLHLLRSEGGKSMRLFE